MSPLEPGGSQIVRIRRRSKNKIGTHRGVQALRSNSTAAQREYDEQEYARYQQGTNPIHLFGLLLGRLVGVRGENTSDGDQSRSTCRNVENGSPSFAVQHVEPSATFHH